MSRIERNDLFTGVLGRISALGAFFVIAGSIGGCSADLARFDFPSAGYREGGSASTSALPTPSEPLRRSSAGIAFDNDPPPPPSASRSYDAPYQGDSGAPPPVRTSRLPEPPPAAPRYEPRASTPPRSPAVADYAPQTPPPASPPPASHSGNTIEVQPGDTLYGISKQYRVSISELMKANNLQSPAIKPGQQIVVPGRRIAQRRPAPTAGGLSQQASAQPHAAPHAPAAHAPPASPVPAAEATAPDWSGSYTVKSGDSLYGIARRHNVKVADLQSANGITDPRRIKPGASLKVPAMGGPIGPQPPAKPVRTVAIAPSAPATPAPVTPAPVTASAESQTGPSVRPTIINGAAPAAENPRVASLGSGAPVQTDAAPVGAPEARQDVASAAPEAATPGTSGRFRWPVKGKIISGFGARADNTHNDGINISVPQGTEVLAAENGVVAYAGSELKGYGNLVLVRHENNWVSAYAHNDKLLVKRGDKVRRGQKIATAGNSGTVDQPQVHFELRQGSKPVDPVPFLEKN